MTSRRPPATCPAVALAIAMACVLAACGGLRTVRNAPLSTSQAESANAILFRAFGLVGTPYRYGGNTPEGGFDCSGLVDFVYREAAGIGLPRTADAIGKLDLPSVPRERLQPGDLVFFTHRGSKIGHVGIYVGEGRFVHAPNEGGTVRLDLLDGPYWKEHYAGAKRALP